MELNISIYVNEELKGCKQVTVPCVIGRGKESGLSIGDRSVSRKHCELYEAAGKLFLRDCGSLNGTRFKGEYVEDPVALSFNDEFSIGDLVFRLASPAKALSDEQKQIAERPTASFVSGSNSEDESIPMIRTLMEQSKNPLEELSEEKAGAAAENKVPDKIPKKVSPHNIRIVP